MNIAVCRKAPATPVILKTLPKHYTASNSPYFLFGDKHVDSSGFPWPRFEEETEETCMAMNWCKIWVSFFHQFECIYLADIAASNGNKEIMAIKKITQKIHDIFMIYSLFIMKKKKKSNYINWCEGEGEELRGAVVTLSTDCFIGPSFYCQVKKKL